MSEVGDLYIGLMVGTSLDGIDVALVRIHHDGADRIELVSSDCTALEEPLRTRLQNLSLAKYDRVQDPIDELGSLHVETGRQLAGAVKQLLQNAGVEAGRVMAIGSHGVTVRHRPSLAFTMQIGDAAVLSSETGIDVVADMRAKDVALGGQGAPLAPAYHAFAYASKKTDR